MIQNKTLKMMYNDHLEYIDCPKNAKYEECIEIALERFEIPSKFKEFTKVSNECSEIFEKSTFEYYNLLFPSPAIIFYLNIDNNEVDNKHSEEREPFGKLFNNKRKYCDENYGVPVTRQNCFIGSLPETQFSEEPANKKYKSSLCDTRDIGVVRRTISRRSIRV
ncbi:uncharacterized protein LOC129948569 [Eupeodes corollae]|uniref:uncharacterized protein LOC129948569 n=1 Tax=Eupeodes corollae TaxID=290404 RepID=UPI0024913BAC|nr:uncharacterized protein LOC129948569 [Eupeodes corollae]